MGYSSWPKVSFREKGVYLSPIGHKGDFWTRRIDLAVGEQTVTGVQGLCASSME